MALSRSKPKKRISPIWIAVILIGAISLGAALLLLNPADTAAALKPEITVKEAAALRDAGAFILDVRQPEEWADYHVPGSTLIPLDELPNWLSEIPMDQQVVVVCRSGNRSQAGRDILLKAGFDQVASMAGGLSAWRSLGYPTVSGP
jgi:rhodanese-related sulfurtransferase